MKELFLKTAQLLKSGEDCVLVTIIASSGSTPRGTGARMLVGKNGRVYGTVGGGAVEYRSEQLALEALKEKKSYIHAFSLTRSDVEGLGMICGGDVTVHFRCLSADGNGAELASAGASLLSENADVWMLTELSENGLFGFYSKERGFVGTEPLPEAVPLLSRHPRQAELCGRSVYIEQVGSSGAVYIFGGGHVAQELVPVLAHVGFRCVVLEDRPDFLGEKLFPDAEDTRLVDFDNIFEKAELTERDYAVIMTRGHAFDLSVERQVLSRPTRYVGVIGSAKKTAGVNEKLRAAGITDEQLSHVTTPIGVSIHAETPAEIAVSIAAQLIAVRSGK